MTVSPLKFQNGSVAAKAKGLVVRTNPNGVPVSKQPITTEAGPELAEQLNGDTKQKYVKSR